MNLLQTITRDLANTERLGIQIDKVQENVVATAIQTAQEVAKEAAPERVTNFAVKHLKRYTDKLLPDQLKANKVATGDDNFELNGHCEELEDQHKSLDAQVTQSASILNATM